MAELMRRTARQQAPGSPQEFRIFWRDDTIVLDRGVLGRLRRQLMSQGRRNRQLPRVAHDAARRHVAPGARRARPRAGPRGVQRRDALRPGVRRLRDRPGGRRSTRRPCWAGCASPSFLARVADGVLSRRGAACCSPSRGPATGRPLSVEDVPLLDELRYALGDVPARTEDERDLDDTLAAARGRRRPAGADHRLRPRVRPVRARLGAADAPDRGRRVRPRAHRRGAGPHADAVADGRPPRPHRVVDDRRRPGAVVVAGARGGRRGAGRGARGQGSSTSSTSRPTTATPPRSTRTPRRTPSGSASTPTCPTAVRSTGESPRVVTGVARPRGGGPRGRASTIAGRVAGTVGDRGAGRPPLGGQRLAGVVARAGRRRRRRPRRRRLHAPRRSGEDRVVVLTGLDTKGLEFDGIVVVAPAGDRGRVGHRPRHPLRRPDPRHPAASPPSPEQYRRVGADVRRISAESAQMCGRWATGGDGTWRTARCGPELLCSNRCANRMRHGPPPDRRARRRRHAGGARGGCAAPPRRRGRGPAAGGALGRPARERSAAGSPTDPRPAATSGR